MIKKYFIDTNSAIVSRIINVFYFTKLLLY